MRVVLFFKWSNEPKPKQKKDSCLCCFCCWLKQLLDRLTFIPPLGSRPPGRLGLVSVLSQVRSGIWELATPCTICFCFWLFGLHIWDVCPGCTTVLNQVSIRSEAGKQRKTRVDWVDWTNQFSVLFAFFFSLSPLTVPSDRSNDFRTRKLC